MNGRNKRWLEIRWDKLQKEREMVDNINRQVKRKSSKFDAKRREISQGEWYETKVDGAKEARSVLMSRFPKRKEVKKDG